MKKALGLFAAMVVTAGLALPASATPLGTCAGQVDARCTYNDPQQGSKVCDYWLNDGTYYRRYCGELPDVGPI